MSLKQVILVRQDLKLPKGKLATQVAHAATECLLLSSPSLVDEWRHTGMKKCVVKVQDISELMKYHKKARSEGLVSVVIKDAGRTVIPPGTVTCCGIGPHEENVIDEVTGELHLL